MEGQIKKNSHALDLNIGDLDKFIAIDVAHIRAIQACGLDEGKIIEVWRASGSDIIETLIEENVKAMKSLEAKMPGGVKILNEEFGIYNFARYPEGVLLKQIKEKDQANKPYGAIITAFYDHNNSFLDSDWHHVLTKLNSILGNNYAMRITECGDVLNFARTVGKFEKRYGAHQKLSFAILSGHGNDTQFDFGKASDAAHFIDAGKIDLGKQRIARRFKTYEECFAPHASLILDSCAGGSLDADAIADQDALALVLSDALHRRVYAAEGDGSISDIDVLVHDGKVSFFPHYSGAQTHEINPDYT